MPGFWRRALTTKLGHVKDCYCLEEIAIWSLLVALLMKSCFPLLCVQTRVIYCQFSGRPKADWRRRLFRRTFGFLLSYSNRHSNEINIINFCTNGLLRLLYNKQLSLCCVTAINTKWEVIESIRVFGCVIWVKGKFIICLFGEWWCCQILSTYISGSYTFVALIIMAGLSNINKMETESFQTDFLLSSNVRVKSGINRRRH